MTSRPPKNTNTDDLAGILAQINTAYNKGNLGRVEQLCRFGTAGLPDAPWWPYFHALTAHKLGLRQAGLEGCAAARKAFQEKMAPEYAVLTPRLAELKTALDELPDSSSPDSLSPYQAPGYLLIKTWGYGFWSDIRHFVAALLVAEMTGRIPVLHWGAGCRYSDNLEADAFTTFYEPINDVTIGDLEALQGECYPQKWTRDNLRNDRFDQWSGLGARQSGIYLLNRPEQIVVTDFYTQIFELTPWLPPGHWLAGAGALDAFSRLYRKYFTLRPEIQADIDGFTSANFSDAPTLAVHVRNADKAAENTNFDADVAQIMPLLEDYISRVKDLRIFLLTDSAQAVADYRARYGDRVLFTDSERAEGDVGVHVETTQSRRRLGVEVIKDTYLAAACDYFIGLGYSNVPCMVSALKDWPADALHLIGGNTLVEENMLLHDW